MHAPRHTSVPLLACAKHHRPPSLRAGFNSVYTLMLIDSEDQVGCAAASLLPTLAHALLRHACLWPTHHLSRGGPTDHPNTTQPLHDNP